MRGSLLIAMLLWAAPAVAQDPAFSAFKPQRSEPRLDVGRQNFSLPVVEYQAPDGRWKRSSGIIIGQDISPNATVGLGFFKMKPKYTDPAAPNLPSGGKSKKVSVGLSMRF